ncbi:MAG TPA: hypothetical protein VKB76_11345 [Ktedonobacterales bacterium]|nr:hypothetical protein [Ktedonobacterales bacterium]
MSAYLCSDEHLSLLANTIGAGDPLKEDAAFAMLLAENLRSLRHRYSHNAGALNDFANDAEMAKRDTRPASAIVREALASRFAADALTRALLATQMIKACDCYDYQACETDDYRESEAAKAVNDIRQIAKLADGKTEGSLYDKLLWGL